MTTPGDQATDEQETMIDVKKAVEVAYDFILDLPKVGDINPITLEEVELTDDDRYWLITLGLYRSVLPTTTGPVEIFASSVLAKREREYKVVKIHADSGKVQSMKIRDV